MKEESNSVIAEIIIYFIIIFLIAKTASFMQPTFRHTPAASTSGNNKTVQKIPVRSDGIITDATDTLSSKDIDLLNTKLDEQFSNIDVMPYVVVTEDVPDGLSPDTYAKNIRNHWNMKSKDAVVIVVSDDGIGLCGPMDAKKKSSNNIENVMKYYQANALKDEAVTKEAKKKHYKKAIEKMNSQDISEHPVSYFFKEAGIWALSAIIVILGCLLLNLVCNIIVWFVGYKLTGSRVWILK